MTGDHSQRVRALYDRLLDLPPDAREKELDAECAGEPLLRREIEDLLAQDRLTADLPVTPVFDRLRPSDAGPFVGAYRIERPLGEGGFGEVFVAEQAPPLRRRVALKILKAGMDTKAVLRRFEAERQALALMDHPGIAKVFDSGETERGRPYFVMELVDGEPITAFAARHELSVPEKLELFIAVTQAVQHAHQKGIIHRDLKPSNVLVSMVDGRPAPKVIDFGIAKATSHALTEESLCTETGQLIGTPDYMSPEQALMGGLDVDTRTDVYSLGVMLYELLTGSLPFKPAALRQAGIQGIQQIIRDEEPARPSTRVAGRGAAGLLRGDLDWIVLRAMEKDRARRYDSAGAFAADIQRHLRHEPVVAGPPVWTYRASRFARRHRVALSVGVLVLASILLALFESNRQRVVAERARLEAERARDESDAVTRFLSDLLVAASPREGSKDATVRDMLDEGARTIHERFPDQPLVRARLMQNMGNAYQDLGYLEEAQPLMEEAVVLREAALGPIHRDVGYSLNSLAILMRDRGNYARAESLYDRALVVWEQSLGPDHPNVATVLNNLGNVAWTKGDLAKARALYERSLAHRERVRGPEHRDVAQTLNNLGSLLAELGDSATARRHLERALAIREKILPPDHPDVAQALGNLAEHVYRKSEPLKAVESLNRVLAIQEKALGPDHPELGSALMNLGLVLTETGELARARPCIERALAIEERALGPDHVEVARTLIALGILNGREGRREEAQSVLERAISIFEGNGLPEHPDAAPAYSELAAIRRADGDGAAAERLEERAEAIRGKAGIPRP